MLKVTKILPAFLFLFLLLVTTSLAQTDTITLTVSIPAWLEDSFEAPDYFSAFEAANPGVKVVLAPSGDNAFFTSPAADIEGHLDGAAEYAAIADVLYVTENNLSVEASRAGYFLDLAPLAAGDPGLNPNDFFPNAYSAFQWDRGLWAMPVAMSVQLIVYDPAAFDQAGLSYPDEGWTLDDFANVDRTFAEVDANGEVTTPGLAFLGTEALLLRALLGHGFYDDSTLPEQPRFTAADSEALLNTLLEYQNEGLLGGTSSGNINFSELPLVITQPFQLSDFQPEDQKRSGSLLPGGTAGLSVTGFGISSGTQHPEMAYELVKWLSNDVRTVNGFFSNSPARRSLVGVEANDDSDTFAFLATYSEENQALIERGLANGISPAELRYASYLQQALNRIREEQVAPQVALQEAEAQAIENLQIAADRRMTTTVIIATPVPTPILTADQVNLNFGLTSFINPLPNRERWDEVIAEFTATDPEVGQITIDTEFAPSLTAMAEQFDCFYLPYNSVDADDIASVLSLDPFLDADFNFDRNDLLGNVLAQVQRDNRTWAYPLNLQPQVLWYNTNIFADAGVPAPEGGWTTDAFVDALRNIKLEPEDPAPFQPQEFGGNYILMLTAAFGGLPLDYTVQPVGINFTDPTNVAALQQVLDFARDGYIEYSQLASLTGGGFGGGGSDTIPIFSETLNQFSFQRLTSDNEQDDPYRLTGFPQGTQHTPVSYALGTVYISATTANPEGCYRWISKVAEHPELFTSMPARFSQLSNPATTASLGVDMTAFYTEFATLLQAPNVVEFPSPFGGGSSAVGDFVVQFWLNRALDRYVLEDGNLETELADAERFARDYQTCIAGIPPYDPNDYATQLAQLSYFRQFFDCATSVDPSMASMLPNLPG